MKNLLYSLMAFVAIGFTSCNSDDDTPVYIPPVTTANTITSGVWRVTLYQEADNVQTDNFAGYNFTFGSNNSLTATNGTNTYTGQWSLQADDSGTDDFNIFFATPANFAELTDDWDIIESTPVKLRLKHVSGGDGSIDYITFEKNVN